MNNSNLQAALDATHALMENMQRENHKLRGALRYYANPVNMRDIQLNDRGEIARGALGSDNITKRRVDRKKTV